MGHCCRKKRTKGGDGESTALTWLKRLTKQGAPVSVDGKGRYHMNGLIYAFFF